jgi:hypothetical protein
MPSALRSVLACATLILMGIVCRGTLPPDPAQPLRQGFDHPPDDARVMMRWWWFGPAVSKTELARELHVMKDAGIGGVEIQPVYPLELDDPSRHFQNSPYLSDVFIDDLKFAARIAHDLGMRVDITLGSGWPFGGPHTPVTEAAGRLRYQAVPVTEGIGSVPVPSLENGESLIAAFVSSATARPVQLTTVANGCAGKCVSLPGGPNEPRKVLFFISSRTGQQVKRASVGAEGFVLDHYDRSAIEHHLTRVCDRLLQAFPEHPPYAVFSDSLEVYNSDWTPSFLQEFSKRRGYDLTPCLPALAADSTPDTPAIRHDWGQTLTELAEEHYLAPIRGWAHAHRTLFRSQNYGEPPAILSSNTFVDLPEGEAGPLWRSLSAARWASSANHLYGRPITSTETWTWLHAPSFRATPLDMKAEADLHFIQGINQLIGHGWPYSPPSAGEPGWRFYAAAAFNDHNPWFQVMPEIARYLQRVSFLLRQGKPANDVAVYLPTDDAWAHFKPGSVAADTIMGELLGQALIPRILDAGYNFDFIDDRAIASVGVPYRILVLPGIERMPVATLRKLVAFRDQGGILIATRRLPSLAPGFRNAGIDSPRVADLAKQLFDDSHQNTRLVANDGLLGSALTSLSTPDFSVSPDAAPAIGFIHRKLSSGELYFVANTSNQPIVTNAAVRVSGLAAESWDPFSGRTKPVVTTAESGLTRLPLRLAPYESAIFYFTSSTLSGAALSPRFNRASPLDLSANWKVSFAGLSRSVDMSQLRSWTDDAATRFYSGKATYQRSIELTSAFLESAENVALDFGPGEPVAAPSGHGPGMRALLESPVRESALVYVNGQLAGAVWHPPYSIAVKRWLRSGTNELKIVVANLAVNEMADAPLPDYKLLDARYGERFTPQGFENLQPVPAGILGPVKLVPQ